MDLYEGVPKNGTLETPKEAIPADVFNLAVDSVDDFWNSEFMRDFRMRMVRGDYISNCRHCHYLEDIGLSSKRLSKNKRFAKLADQLIQECIEKEGRIDAVPRWWEVRLSTICNLACRMCTPHLSTRFYDEIKANPESSLTPKLAQVDAAAKYGYLSKSLPFRTSLMQALPKIEILEIRGGELFADEAALSILEEISLTPYAGKIHFDLSSNITLLKDKHLEILNRFRSGDIRASIDGFGAENEFIRYGSRWGVIEKNLLRVQKLHPLWSKKIQVTITVYQALTIDKLLRYVDSLCLQNGFEFDFSFSAVRDTPYQAHELIPRALRLESAERVESFRLTSHLCQNSSRKNSHNASIDSLIACLKSAEEPTTEDFESFLRYDSTLNSMRKTSTLEVFPHLNFLFQTKQTAKMGELNALPS